MFLNAGSRLTGGVASRRAFPAGTQLAFINAVAPVGWVRVSTYDDAALRVVGSASPSSGGSNGFSTVMAQTTVGNTTRCHQRTDWPSHTHSINYVQNDRNNNTGSYLYPNIGGSGSTVNTNGNTGGGGSHNHAITLSMKYVDALIAIKS